MKKKEKKIEKLGEIKGWRVSGVGAEDFYAFRTPQECAKIINKINEIIERLNNA